MQSIHFAFWTPRGRTFTHVFEGPHERRSTALIKWYDKSDDDCRGTFWPDAIFFSDTRTREELVVGWVVRVRIRIREAAIGLPRGKEPPGVSGLFRELSQEPRKRLYEWWVQYTIGIKCHKTIGYSVYKSHYKIGEIALSESAEMRNDR